MGGISIESSFNDKNFEVLDVFQIQRVHEKGRKYELEMSKIVQERHLRRRFSLQAIVRDC